MQADGGLGPRKIPVNPSMISCRVLLISQIASESELAGPAAYGVILCDGNNPSRDSSKSWANSSDATKDSSSGSSGSPTYWTEMPRTFR